MTVDAAPRGQRPPEPKRGFRLPSAYTILFILIVVAAARPGSSPPAATTTTRTARRSPGTYHAVDAEPGADRHRLADGARSTACTASRASDGSISYYNSGELFGAIDVALFILVIGGFLGRDHADRAPSRPASHGSSSGCKGRERLMIPILMVAVRPRRHHLRHGRGEPRVLRADHHGDGRGRLRLADAARRSCCWAAASASWAPPSTRSPRASRRGSRASASTRGSSAGWSSWWSALASASGG